MLGKIITADAIEWTHHIASFHIRSPPGLNLLNPFNPGSDSLESVESAKAKSPSHRRPLNPPGLNSLPDPESSKSTGLEFPKSFESSESP